MFQFLHHVSSAMRANANTAAVTFAASAFMMTSVTQCQDGALNPTEWRSFRVTQVDQVTHNVSRIQFALPNASDKIGMPIASCLVARATIDGKAVIRPYTPVTSQNERGTFDLVVKGYEQGKVSKHIVQLSPGDTLDMKGPFKKYPYEANSKRVIGLIAGGSGITPMLQVMREILYNPNDQTQVRLLFANITEEDIILRDELDALAYHYPDRLTITYCLDQPPLNGWRGYSGYITKDMILETMPAPSPEHLIMVCGPPPMMFHLSGNKAEDKSQGELEGLLRDLEYTSEQVFKF